MAFTQPVDDTLGLNRWLTTGCGTGATDIVVNELNENDLNSSGGWIGLDPDVAGKQELAHYSGFNYLTNTITLDERGVYFDKNGAKQTGVGVTHDATTCKVIIPTTAAYWYELLNTAVTFADITATTADINGGTIDGAAINSTTIGATTPSTGKFSSLEVEGSTPNLYLDATSGDPAVVYQEGGTDEWYSWYDTTTNAFKITEAGIGDAIRIDDNAAINLYRNTMISGGGGLYIKDNSGNPALQIQVDRGVASDVMILNAWGSSINPGITVGTIRTDGYAFQVHSATPTTGGTPTGSGTPVLRVGGDGICDLPQSGDYYAREGDAITQKVGEQYIAYTQGSSSDPLTINTGLDKIHRISIYAVCENTNETSYGSAETNGTPSSAPSDRCGNIDVGTAVAFDASNIINVGGTGEITGWNSEYGTTADGEFEIDFSSVTAGHVIHMIIQSEGY